MATFTVSIPRELKIKLDEHPDINWPEYIKQKFAQKLAKIDKVN